MTAECWNLQFFGSPVLGKRSVLNMEQQQKKDEEYSTPDFNLATRNMHNLTWILLVSNIDQIVGFASNDELMELANARCISDNDGSTWEFKLVLDRENPSDRIDCGCIPILTCKNLQARYAHAAQWICNSKLECCYRFLTPTSSPWQI